MNNGRSLFSTFPAKEWCKPFSFLHKRLIFFFFHFNIQFICIKMEKDMLSIQITALLEMVLALMLYNL